MCSQQSRPAKQNRKCSDEAACTARCTSDNCGVEEWDPDYRTVGTIWNWKVFNALARHFKLGSSDSHLISNEGGNTYNAGNQVGLGTPSVFYYVGRPNETIKVTRKKLLARYWTDSFVAYPGNEDGGSMSARFVLEYGGIYNHSFGTSRLHLMYPGFQHMEYDLDDNRKKLVVKIDPASTTSSTNNEACIESVTIDGFDHDMDPSTAVQNNVNHTKSYIYYQNIGTNTVVSFKIVPRPVVNRRTLDCRTVTTWGRKAADIPPSNTDLD